MSGINELIKVFFQDKKNYLLLVGVTLLALIPLFVWIPYVLFVLTFAFIFAIGAIGWNISYGYAGLLSFGHSTFWGMAAYICVFLFRLYYLTPWIGIFVGAFVAGIFGIIVGWATTKARGLYFSLATMVLPSILVILFTWGYEFTGGSFGLPIPYMGENAFFMQFNSKVPFYYISLAFLIVCMIALKIIDGSKIGHYLKAIGRDEEAAESIGIDIFRTRLLAMGISSFVVGLAGGLYANMIHFIDPYEAFGWTMNVYFILSTMIGGVGTMIGPAIGAMILIPTSEVLKLTLEQQLGRRFIGVHFIIYGLILMAMVVKMPEGAYVAIKRRFIKDHDKG